MFGTGVVIGIYTFLRDGGKKAGKCVAVVHGKRDWSGTEAGCVGVQYRYGQRRNLA